MGRPSASRWGQLSIWTDWAASPSCVRQGVDTAVRAVACDQFFNGVANHADWAAQACVYYDSAAKMMKLAEGVETDKEIKAELTSGAAECVRRAKELRDALAKPAGCGCPGCKASGPPKKEEPKKEALKKEEPKKEAAAKHCMCVVCVPAAQKAGYWCHQYTYPAQSVMHLTCTCKEPKKEPKKEEPKKEPKKEELKKETPKKDAPPYYMPVCYPWPAVQWCYPMQPVCYVPAKK